MEKPRPKISELESAIRQLDSVKKHLYYTSSQIKSQIHSSISRHLEALRNREVWLLSQVDLVLSAKEEVLQQQQARLNKTFGILQSSLALSEDGDGLEAKLAEKLSTLDIADLKPEETPYLSFCADQVGLREAILNYGRVESNGIPLQTAFIDQENVSTCMPGHFEDYEDADHHIFYKTIEEINASQKPSGSIRVNIPKLSTRAKDWLYQPPGCKTLSTATIPKFSFPAFSTDPHDWVPAGSGKECSPRMYGDSCIQNWLSQIQQSPAFEDEDDFEIVGSSLSETTPPVTDKPVFETFPLTNKAMWLKQTPSDSSEEKAKETSLSWFVLIPNDTDIWLIKSAKKDEEKKKESCETLGSDNSEQPSDRAARIMEAFFKELPKCWLKGENSDAAKTGERNCECKPECFPCQQAVENFNWLKTGNEKSCSNEQADRTVNSLLLLPQKLEEKKWVAAAAAAATSENTDTASSSRCEFGFFKMLSSNLQDWLKQNETGLNKKSPTTSTSFKFHFAADALEGPKWLKSVEVPSEAFTIPECWKVIQNMHKKMSDKDWLLTSCEENKSVSNDKGVAKNAGSTDNTNGKEKLKPEVTCKSSLDHWLL